MSDDFRKGDRVTWNGHGGTAEGAVEREIAEARHPVPED